MTLRARQNGERQHAFIPSGNLKVLLIGTFTTFKNTSIYNNVKLQTLMYCEELECAAEQDVMSLRSGAV